MRWDTFDIAFIGTSLTSNLGPGPWLNGFRAILQIAKQRPISCYDLGLAGAVSSYAVSTAPYVAKLAPKVAVLEFGMNDAYTPLLVPVATFGTNIESAVDILKAGAPQTSIFLMTMNPAIAPGDANVPNLLAYYQKLRDVAAAENVGLIDNTALWGTPNGTQIPDGIHPTTAAAMSIMVPNIISAISPLAV